MANICTEIVAIAGSEEDLLPILHEMVDNSIRCGGPEFEVVDSKGLEYNVFMLNDLLARNYRNYLTLFTDEPDRGSEGGSLLHYRYGGRHLIEVCMGLKWGGSEQPYDFLMDREKIGWSIADGGESFQYEMAEIDGDYCYKPEFE
jgi:hypothetical protein